MPEPGLSVVKVGGSLFDWPDLGPRLRAFLQELSCPRVLLVPGGGPIVEHIRLLDQRHGLGEEKSHWLALQGMALTARFLESLVPGSVILGDLRELPPEGLSILDVYAFCREQATALPATWELTSDAIALAAALQTGAKTLVLLKSMTISENLTWFEASELGYVDEQFPRMLASAPEGLAITAINLRAGARN